MCSFKCDWSLFTIKGQILKLCPPRKLLRLRKQLVKPSREISSGLAFRRAKMLALEVTPRLQQEQSPTPISLCHDLLKGGDRMEVNSGQYLLLRKLGWNNKDMRGLDLT
jgi:hypothetical protein